MNMDSKQSSFDALRLIKTFKGLTSPEVFLTDHDRVCIPDVFSIQVDGNKDSVYKHLRWSYLKQTSAQFQESFLDILYVLLRTDIYDVVRFKCHSGPDMDKYDLNHTMLELLDDCIKYKAPVSITKRVIHLVGLVGKAGFSATDLKKYLEFLKTPSELSISLLQAFRVMFREDQGITKASPSSFFTFAGKGSGLFAHLQSLPFSREYQFCSWFRVETFDTADSAREGMTEKTLRELESALKSSFPLCAEDSFEEKEYKNFPLQYKSSISQHIFSWHNTETGIDLFLSDHFLAIGISSNSKKSQPLRRFEEYPLRKGTWYHISVKHTKPRLSIFSSDELTIYLDHQVIYQECVKFPNTSTNKTDTMVEFGKNFNGQLGSVFMFSESTSRSVIETVARLDAGKTVDGMRNNSPGTSMMVDLLPSVTSSAPSSDGKKKTMVPIPKIALTYHPLRCFNGFALDIHGGRHAHLGPNSWPCSVPSIRESLTSIGGLANILPLFPKLLIQSKSSAQLAAEAQLAASLPLPPPAARGTPPSILQKKTTATSSLQRIEEEERKGQGQLCSLGSPLSDLYDSECRSSGEDSPNDRVQVEPVSTLLSAKVVRLIRGEREEFSGEGCIGLLLSILARFIRSHPLHQQEMFSTGVVEMLEFALSRISKQMLHAEGEKCVLALIQLKSAATDCAPLELKISKLLLCNIALWIEASFQFLSSYMSIILASIRAQPQFYIDVLKLPLLLDIKTFYDEIIIKQGHVSQNGNNDSGSSTPLENNTPRELEELALYVKNMLILRKNTSTSSQKLGELSKYKKVSVLWNGCLQKTDGVLSPWQVDLQAPVPLTSSRQSGRDRHRDSSSSTRDKDRRGIEISEMKSEGGSLNNQSSSSGATDSAASSSSGSSEKISNNNTSSADITTIINKSESFDDTLSTSRPPRGNRSRTTSNSSSGSGSGSSNNSNGSNGDRGSSKKSKDAEKVHRSRRRLSSNSPRQSSSDLGKPSLSRSLSSSSTSLSLLSSSRSGSFSQASPSRPQCHYQLSEHKDRFMRKMLLEKSPVPIDYADTAYLDGKVTDQKNFENGLLTEKSNVFQNRKNMAAIMSFDVEASFGKSIKQRAEDVEEELADMDHSDDEHVGDRTNNIYSPSKSKISFFLPSEIERPGWTKHFNWHTDEKALFQAEGNQITLDQMAPGIALLSSKHLYFHFLSNTDKDDDAGPAFGSSAFSSSTSSSSPSLETTSSPSAAGVSSASPISTFMPQDQRWCLDQLVEVYSRRYLLQTSAIELFYCDSTEVYLAFKTQQELQKFFASLMKQNLPLLITPRSLNPRYVFNHSPWKTLWRKRLISNFEYLMRINIMAGRSHNDITQYPVFPWVIADYKSETLDLTNPATFRQLDKPVGAQNPERLKEFVERYNSLDDDDYIPKFMYGSHYSSAGVVIHYMMRQEPYTTMAINFQGGRFDCPDRLFFDIARTWDGCNQAMSDVKELIPELYSVPEVLLNTNNLPLGDLQEGDKVNNVKLPPWANNNAYNFIRLNREALECEYVSEHLHEWIDLIFGYKQTGEAAEEAHNVFYYLTYENSIDIESIEDQLQRQATKAQVTNFGQTPSQLLINPHPKRMAREDCIMPLYHDISRKDHVNVYSPLKQMGFSFGSVIAMYCSHDRMVVLHSSLNLCYYRWSSFPDGDGNPFTLKFDRSKPLPSSFLSASENNLKGRALVLWSDDGSIRSRSSSSTVKGFSSLGSSSSGGITKPPAASPTSPQSVRHRAATSFSEHQQGGQSGSNGQQQQRQQQRTSTCSIRTERHSNAALGFSDNGQIRLSTCGYWDYSVKLHSLESSGYIKECASLQVGAITCLKQSASGHILLTAGEDATVRVWSHTSTSGGAGTGGAPLQDIFFDLSPLDELSPNPFSGSIPFSTAADSLNGNSSSSGLTPNHCQFILWGHSSPVLSLFYSEELDLVLSGGKDGLLCLHTVRQGRFVRSIAHLMHQKLPGGGEGTSADLCLISSQGYLVAHSWTDMQMHVFWVNGQHLLSVKFSHRVTCMVSDSTGKLLICGLENGVVSIREITAENLMKVSNIQLSDHGSITCLWFTEDYQFLFMGSEDGVFTIATDAEARWRVFSSALKNTTLLGG